MKQINLIAAIWEKSCLPKINKLNLLSRIIGLLFILLFFSLPLTTKAQLAEFYYGLADRDEVSNDVKRTGNGEIVIVGYSSDQSDPSIRDYFITLINSSGNVVWSRRGGTSHADVLEKVIVASNGDYIAVGYSNENTAGNQTNSLKRALIVRYSSVGTLLWRHHYRVSPFGSAGDRFTDVCELSNGNLVASGVYDERGNFADGLVAYMDANGNVTTPGFLRCTMNPDWPLPDSYSDGYYGITTDGTDVFLSGTSGDGGQIDGIITQMDASGSVVFNSKYDYYSGFTINSINNEYNWFTDIFIRDNKLVVNAYNFNDYNTVNSCVHGIVITDIDGLNPRVAEVENYLISTNKYCNYTDFYPLSSVDYFTLENPASTLYATHLGMPGSDATISRFDATVPSSATLSRSIPRTGEQTLKAIDISASLATMVGSATDDPDNIGGYDIYMLNSDYNFTTQNGCMLSDISLETRDPGVTRYDNFNTLSILSPTDSTGFDDDTTKFSEVLLCGENPDPDPNDTTKCPDKCYWRLNGNSSVSSTDFIGPINNEDFRIHTTNQLRVTVEKDYGNIGIGTHPGQEARLLIQHDDVGETNFHTFFLKTKYKTADDFFAVAKTGSGASFTPLLWGHKESVDENAGLIGVGTTNPANDYPSTSGAAIQEFKSFLSDVDGQALSDPTQRLLFNFGNLSQNFMKMSHYGYVGIGLQTKTTYPTARLHVDCIDIDPSIGNPSNIRFQNLQFKSAPYYLVIDNLGYVYRSQLPPTGDPNPPGITTDPSNGTTDEDVKKLKQEVEDLKNLVYELSKQTAEQGSNPNDNATGANRSQTAYLIDNVPNPYSQSTLIRYYLPVGTTNASITVSSNEGVVLDTITLMGDGMGTLVYNAGSLADGTYSYTLVVSGQKIDTKKMVIAR